MTYEEICDKVAEIKSRYAESDPFRLIKDMGIVLIFRAMGKGEDAIKGFFLECNRIKMITINSDLPVAIQRIIAAHEVGHAVLHYSSEVQAFHEVGLFDESTIMEKDANLFAAEYLMNDEDVFSVLNADYTFFGAAAALRVPVELLDFKFRIMKWRGFKLSAPIEARSNFLRDLEVPFNADNHVC